MTERELLIQIAAFLNMIVQGIKVPNERKEAEELMEKIGEALTEPRP